MSEIVRELTSQPDTWRRAAAEAPGVAAVLPRSGDRVAAVGCGTSLFVAQAYAALREAAGAGETDAFPASEAPGGRIYDVVMAISRSGTTTEVARLLERPWQDARSVAICGVDDTPVANAADDRILLGFADERSVVQTRFATGALALLRAGLGEDLEPARPDGERALAADLPIDLGAFDHFVFLGRGWTVGLANEAALKMREASGSVGRVVPGDGVSPRPHQRGGHRARRSGRSATSSRDLLQDVAATGATIVDHGLGAIDPMAELILVQRTAVALAEARGMDPDRPRHLTRSVVLS